MKIRAHVNCNPKASKATKRALLAAIRHVHKTMGKKHKAITATSGGA